MDTYAGVHYKKSFENIFNLIDFHSLIILHLVYGMLKQRGSIVHI